MTAMSFADKSRGRDNNFHLVRMLAALLVLVSHSWPLTGTPGEPLERFTDFSLGHLGVDIFFVVSGFLVTGSLVARESLVSFLRARALRIFPALAVCAFGCAFVIGPLVTEWALPRYLSNWETWRFALQNSVTWPFGVSWWLPGVFRHNPGGPAVNGALWSLPWELTMYVMLVALGVLRAVRLGPSALQRLVLVIAVTATAAHALNEAMGLTHRFELVQGFRLTALFFTAGSLQLYKERVPLHGAWALIAAILLAASLAMKGAALGFYPLMLGYVVLWLALVPGGLLRGYRRMGDYSYGLYLWQFPIQQCLVLAVPGLTPATLIGWSFGSTMVLAVASWHGVESPALAYKPGRRPAKGTSVS